MYLRSAKKPTPCYEAKTGHRINPHEFQCGMNRCDAFVEKAKIDSKLTRNYLGLGKRDQEKRRIK